MATEKKRPYDVPYQELLTILDDVNSLQNTQRTLHSMIAQLVKRIDCQCCAVIQLNPENELLEISNFHNLSWNFCKNYRKQITNPVMSELIWSGETIYIPNREYAATFADEFTLEHDFKSAIAVQLIANQQPMGFLYLDANEYEAFDEEQQLIIKIYARIVSIAIFKQRLSERLKTLEIHDEDSGAIRYERYFPVLQDNFHRTSRLNEKMSLMIIDVEKYGDILKMYGIEKARIVLKELVRILEPNLRKYDGLCRFGADEFLIVLPGTSSDEALDVAGKLSRVIAQAEYTDQKLKIDTFIGVSNFPENSKSLNGLIKAAKNGLIAAKREDSNKKIYFMKEIFE